MSCEGALLVAWGEQDVVWLARADGRSRGARRLSRPGEPARQPTLTSVGGLTLGAWVEGQRGRIVYAEGALGCP